MKPHSQRFLFDTPGLYRIRVEGRLAPEWTDMVGGMIICERRRKGKPTVTILTGTVTDQASLMGVLSALYDRGYTLLDVKRLPDPLGAETANVSVAV